MSEQKEDDTTLLSRSGVFKVMPLGGPPKVHYLLVLEGDGKGQRIELGRDALVIGRAAPADIVLPDPRISRSHCRLVVVDDELIVADLQSSNGTFLNGQRVTASLPFPVGARLQVGSHVLEHELRNQKEIKDSQELDRDIEHASRYIQSLLPTPLAEGPIRTDWVLEPCARLGGDAFGYRFLDATHFAMYLIDVSGHGAGAAMHAVSIINVLRQGALPNVDFRDPGAVLMAMNTMFRMETHGDMYLTMWYGVYDVGAETLTHGCAGHHAAYLVGPNRDTAVPLMAKNRAIGIAAATAYNAQTVEVPRGSTLYVFSDGVFEITTKAGSDWDLEHFVPLLLEPPVPGRTESARLLDRVREESRDPDLQDDFCLMAFGFHRPADRGTFDATWPSRP